VGRGWREASKSADAKWPAVAEARPASGRTDLSQRWETIADSPFTWRDEAETLRAVAETVGRRWVAALKRTRGDNRRRIPPSVDGCDFGPAFMMLAGYSLEVLVKGIIIAQHPEEVRELWKRLTRGHDLLALVTQAGITFSPSAQGVRRARGRSCHVVRPVSSAENGRRDDSGPQMGLPLTPRREGVS
jgi:hypothetical protein